MLKVSVIIPTYNYAHYILDALKSIENQQYPLQLIEIIIIDDGSTDNTPELFKNYTGILNLKYYYQRNQGKANATQRGIDLCTGEIILNLDADDYFYPTKIKKVVDIYLKNPSLTHVAHPAEIIENGLSKGLESIPNSLLEKVIDGKKLIIYFLKNRLLMGGGSTFSAKASVLKTHVIPKQVDMYIDEYLVYQAAINGSSYFLDEGLSVWRVHGKNYSVNSNQDQSNKAKRLLSSSEGMLTFVTQQIQEQTILKLYQLKHLDRYLNMKEKIGKKNLKDILKLLKHILSLQHSFKDLWTYRLFFRLLPASLINKLKRTHG